MQSLGENFRSRSAEQHENALALLKSPEFITDPEKQAMFVVGKLTANVLHVLGEMVDYLDGAGKMNAADDRRTKILERNDAIRNAAASGNWEEFDRLVSQFGKSGHTGSD